MASFVKTFKPAFYQEQLGTSFSRVNSIRPMHESVRSYLVYSIGFELAFGVISYLGVVLGEFDPYDPWALYACAVFGTVSIVFALLTLVWLIVDLMRGKRLSTMEAPVLRAKLRGQSKSHRYAARRSHLRGMSIGAAFFGILCAFAVCIQILASLDLIKHLE